MAAAVPQDEIVRSRLVLIGSTRAGKSTTGNLLLHWSPSCSQPDGPEDRPFTVSDGIDACSTRVHAEYSEKNKWWVVDTPGLGDLPPKLETEGKEAYKARCRQRSEKFFTSITDELRLHGGTILYVQKSAAVGGQAERHLKALNLVLHGSFTTSVVLVLTNVPNRLLYGSGTEIITEEDRNKVSQAYYGWLRQTALQLQAKFSFKFAGVVGISNSFAIDKEHPAHPRALAGNLQYLSRSWCVCLPKGVAMLWKEVIQEKYSNAKLAEEVTQALAKVTASMQEINSNLAHSRRQMRHAANALIAAPFIMATEPVWWLLMLPGLGAGAGAVAAGAAGGAKAKYDAEIKILEARKAELTEAVVKHRQTLEAISMGKSAKELRKEGDKIKSLVYDD